jgi:hypothetical protein
VIGVAIQRPYMRTLDGFLRTARYLIHDRDPLYTSVVADILTSAGIQPIRPPPSSPNLNAYAERFVRSIKEECLNRVVPLGERHLRLLTREYVEHKHSERNHQGLDNRLLQHTPPPKRGHPRAAARPPRRTPQFLLSRGRVSGRPIKRTLRRRSILGELYGRWLSKSLGSVWLPRCLEPRAISGC